MAEGQCGEIQRLLDSHLRTAQDLCGRCDKQLHVKGKIFFFLYAKGILLNFMNTVNYSFVCMSFI